MNAHAVGQRIKAAREVKGLTQEKLAALVDLSPTHISVIERGLKIPNLDSFVAIANALDVSTNSLLLGVVVHASESAACELSKKLSKLRLPETFHPVIKSTKLDIVFQAPAVVGKPTLAAF